MQKLKLNLKARGADEILSREELKKIVGGTVDYGSGTCGAYVPLSANNGAGNLAGSGASFKGAEYSVTPEACTYRGMSKQFVLDITRGVSGAKWCCDNCDKASWY